MTHDKLVEVVARAIYEKSKNGYEHDASCPWNTWETHPETPQQASRCGEIFGKDEFRELARAALAAVHDALREPSAEMVETAKHARLFREEAPQWIDTNSRATWANMLAASPLVPPTQRDGVA